jgi:hypothetical protein
MIMKQERKRPGIGDVLEVETPSGLAYFQYTFKHIAPPVYGELIRVLPGLYQFRPSHLAELVREKERFFTFYPVGAACRKDLVKIVGREQIPPSAKGIPLMRKAGWRDQNGRITGWWLWDGKKTWAVEALTPEQMALSILAVWNHAMLVERIAKGWMPCDVNENRVEAGTDKSEISEQSAVSTADESVLEQLRVAGSDLKLPHQIRHYLYFPTKAIAEGVAEQLRREDYGVDVRRSAHGESWLVLASHSVMPTAKIIGDIRTHLEAVASAMHGEYDGWDAAVAK